MLENPIRPDSPLSPLGHTTPNALHHSAQDSMRRQCTRRPTSSQDRFRRSWRQFLLCSSLSGGVAAPLHWLRPSGPLLIEAMPTSRAAFAGPLPADPRQHSMLLISSYHGCNARQSAYLNGCRGQSLCNPAKLGGAQNLSPKRNLNKSHGKSPLPKGIRIHNRIWETPKSQKIRAVGIIVIADQPFKIGSCPLHRSHRMRLSSKLHDVTGEKCGQT